jgi:hypothetical protein
VCDNVGDHLIGNVYARFDWEDEAQRAVEELNKRWYAGQSQGLSPRVFSGCIWIGQLRRCSILA